MNDIIAVKADLGRSLCLIEAEIHDGKIYLDAYREFHTGTDDIRDAAIRATIGKDDAEIRDFRRSRSNAEVMRKAAAIIATALAFPGTRLTADALKVALTAAGARATYNA